MAPEWDRRSTHSRRQAAIAATAMAIGVAGGSDEASAANAKAQKRKVKDIKAELHRMSADVEGLEQMASRLESIAGAEDMGADLRTIIASLESKRRLALSR